MKHHIYLCGLLFFVSTACNDHYIGQVNQPVSIIQDGIIESRITLQNDSLLYSVNNVGSQNLTNLVIQVQLYDSSSKTSGHLLSTNFVKINLKAGGKSNSTFLQKNYDQFNKSTALIRILSVDQYGLLPKVSGLYSGLYWITDLSKNDSIASLMQGAVDYKGTFSFESLPTGPRFTFINGTLNSDHSMNALFEKTSAIVWQYNGPYLTPTDSVKAYKILPNVNFRISLFLKRTMP